jgi:hypothetical protein
MVNQSEDVPSNETNQPSESIIDINRISIPLSLDGTNLGQEPFFVVRPGQQHILGITDLLHLQNRESERITLRELSSLSPNEISISMLKRNLIRRTQNGGH